MTTFSIAQTLNDDGNDPAQVTVVSPTEGNLLIAVGSERSGTGQAAHTMTGGGTWTKRVSIDQELGDANARHSVTVWERIVGASEGNSTVTFDDGTANDKGLTVIEVSPSASYDFSFVEEVHADSGTAHWGGLNSGNTSNISGSDLFVIAMGAARHGAVITTATFSPQTDSNTVYSTGSNTRTHAYSIHASGQSGGVKTTTVTSSGNSHEGAVWVLVYEDSAGGTNTNVPLDAGSYTLTGNSIDIPINRDVPLDAGSFTLTGNTIDIMTGAVVDLDAGSYTLTGHDIAINIDTVVALDAGSYSLTGFDATFTVDTPVALDAGSYTLTGFDTTTSLGRNVSLDAGSYTLTGFDATISTTGAIALDPGSYTLTGFDVVSTINRTVALDAGSYTTTGFDLNVILGRNVDLDAGSYTLTGNDLTVNTNKNVDLDAGVFTLTGNSVTITTGANTVVSLDLASYTLSGLDTTINRDLNVALDSGSYTFTGLDTGMIMVPTLPVQNVGTNRVVLVLGENRARIVTPLAPSRVAIVT